MPFRDFELARPTPGGGKRYVSVSGLPVFDENGRFTGYRGVGRHITDRKQAEQALREAQTELAHVNRVATMGQLTASIAHEVNQPIGAAVINAQAALRLLRASPPDLEEVRHALGQIIESGRRAGDVIGRIRALIKKAPPRNSRFDLNEAILDVIALIRSEVLKHGVALQTELATSLPSVDGDRVQLQQVILNLIMNAAEAMSDLREETRELLISTQTDAAGGVLVAVREARPGPGPHKCAPRFRGLLHHKVRRFGYGSGDLPVDHRGTRRPAVGQRKRAAGGSISIYIAAKPGRGRSDRSR